MKVCRSFLIELNLKEFHYKKANRFFLIELVVRCLT